MDTSNKIDIIRLNTSSYQGEDFHQREKEELESKFPVSYQSEVNPSRDHILITNSYSNIDSLDLNEKTKLIIHPNSGYDNFHLDIVQNSPCPIIIGNEIRMNAVVNYTISCLLKHLNKLSSSKEWDSTRTWNRILPENLKILVIGHGHIGEKVTSILKSLGASPSIYDPYKGYTELDNNGAQVVLVCASLNPKSKALIDKSFLDALDSNALIINGARGKIIDQNALIDFLKLNKESFAYLDVFEKEPYSRGEFSDLNNISPTSHIAGVHNSLNFDIIKFECKILESYFSSPSREDFERENQAALLQNRIRENFLI